MGSGVFATSVLAATVSGVGSDPRVSSGVVQRDGEGESVIAVKNLLQAGDDRNERVVELWGLVFAEILLSREMLVNVLNN